MSVRRHFFFILLFFFAHYTAAGKGTNMPVPAPGKKTFAFIENKGQVTDQYNRPRNDIDFKLDLPGLTVFIGSGQIHYQWYSAPSPFDNTVASYRLDMQLQGALDNIIPVKEEITPYTEQYLTGNKELSAQSCKKITYPGIYPGIDWVVYCKEAKLEYDFIIHKGADPAVIKMLYDGSKELLLQQGGLRVTTPMGHIYEHAPLCYVKSTGEEVASRFLLTGNTVEIETGSYSGELIIDPVVDFTTYYGDNNTDIGNAVAADNRGNTYLTGTTSSANIATLGAHQVALQGAADGFIVAFDLDGNRRWATYFGGSGIDSCLDAVCDPSGNIYVCGSTSSNSGIAAGSGQQLLYGGGASDGFLVKFNRKGDRVWGSFFGGAGTDAVNNVTCDIQGNIFICGSTTSSTGISFNNPHQLNIAGQKDGFVARFTPQGQRQWATYYGGPGADEVNFNACDLFGNLYIYGTTISATGIITIAGAHQSAINSTSPTTFLVKFNIAGTVQWNTYFGGTSGATPGGVVCDAIGDVYICGYTTSNTGIAMGTGQQLVKGAGEDGFISRFSSSGGQTWGSYFGDAGQDRFTGITITPKGRLFLSGSTTSNSNMITPGALQPTLNGPDDAHISEWARPGSLVYASYLGGNNNENLAQGPWGSFIEYNFGKIYLGGTTNSLSGLASSNGFRQFYSGGFSDAFLASQVVDTICYVLAAQFTDTVVCEGQTFNLPYDVTLPFDPPNNFTAELSDASGSFASPVNIGNIIKDTGGNISCTVPLGTLPGTGYRIRLVASSPSYTSVDNGTDIKIDNIPLIPNISNNAPQCTGDTVKLAVTNPQPGVNYLWTGPGFTGSAVSVTFNKSVPSIQGVYNITPTAGTCTGPDASTLVTLKPVPAITNKGSNAPICEGETLHLSAQSDSANTTYTWTGPSFSSSQQNPAITNVTSAASGVYTVAAILNGCPSKKDSVQVNIKHKPVLAKTSNSPVCETDTLSFSALDNEGQTVYGWAGPGGFTSSSATNNILNITFGNAGTYIVTADNDGCITIDSISIAVKPMPYPGAGSNSPICSGERLQMHATSKDSATTFNWYGPDDFNKTGANPFVEHARYIATGLYRVIANLNGCMQEDTTSVKVTQAPTTVITTNSPVYSTQQIKINASNNVNNAAYSWTGPNGFSTSSQNITIDNASAGNAGKYILKTSYENCFSVDSVSIEVLDFLGYQVFILYPNPNNGTFYLKGVTLKDIELPVTICDMAGRVVYKDKLKTLNNLLDSKIELADRLAGGVYILSLRVEGELKEYKFTITR